VGNDRQAMAATLVGAVIGGLAGYVFFTEKGRAWRRQLEPQLEELARELEQFRGTVRRASSVAGQGWRLLNEAMQENVGTHQQATDAPFARSGQSHPF
jgi:hypothetical protein